MSLLPASRPLLLGIAFVSGAAALIYQTVWLRWFRLLFGNTAYAASATLCAFFLGLALGAALFGRAAGRTSRPLRLYGWIEISAVVLALLVPGAIALYDPIYAWLYARMAESRAAFVSVKFGLGLLAMLPPAVMLGGTLPPLAAAFVSDPGQLGRDGGRLYALNTLGAAAGAAIGALWLPERLGVTATYGVAMGLALLAAAGAFAVSRPVALAAPREDASNTAPSVLMGIAFASGLGTLALEVLLMRTLQQLGATTVYTYGAVLLVVLLCLAAGAALASASEGRVPARRLLLGALTLEALLLLALPAVVVSATRGLGLWVSGSLLHGLGLAAAVGGPALLVGALILPLTFRLGAGGAVGPRVGGLLAANTLGGVLGSVGASLVLLETLGLWSSFAALAGLYAAVAVWLAPSPRLRLGLAGAGALAAVAVFATPLSPRTLTVVSVKPGERVLAVAEGAHGIVSVVELGGDRRIKIDNHYSLAGSAAAKTEERAGHLPLLLHPAPRRVAFVGSASGGTAGAAVLHPVESIALIEIVPEVHALAAEWFAESSRGVHRDPRTRLVVEDGRNHLRAAPERYDVVVADLFVPWRPGVGSLYSREHFEAVRDHLAPGGLFCQWLPIYQLRGSDLTRIVSTFVSVFPDAALWRGDFFATGPRAALIGRNGPPPSLGEIGARLGELATRGVEDRWVTDPRAFWMLYVGPAAGLGPEVGEVPANTDDRPRFEFQAGRSRPAQRRAFLRQDWDTWIERASRRAANDPYADAPGPGAAAANAFARANRHSIERRGPAARAALQEVQRLVPAELLEPPDPSVAEVWPR
jgi:spermidine synthase